MGQVMSKHFNFDKYVEYIKVIGALSKLFSTSETPFIQYRFVEFSLLNYLKEKILLGKTILSIQLQKKVLLLELKHLLQTNQPSIRKKKLLNLIKITLNLLTVNHLKLQLGRLLNGEILESYQMQKSKILT